MRNYLAPTRGNFQVWLTYRFGFFFTIIGNIIYLGVAYYLWRSIYQHAEVIRGLTFADLRIHSAESGLVIPAPELATHHPL